MPRRKAKADAPNDSEQDWPHSDPLHRLDLAGVIENLECRLLTRHPSPDAAEKFLKLARDSSKYVGLGYQPSDRDRLKAWVTDLPKEPTMSERLADLLPVLWADCRLWWALAQTPPEKGVLKDSLASHLLLKFYNLQIPFCDSVWRELRAQLPKWNYTQILMTCNADCFFCLQAASAKDELKDSERPFLSEVLVGKLLHRYTANPLRDWRPVLWRAQLPKAVLRRLQQAAGRLAEDSAWCLAHPDLLLPSRAPALPHRVRSLREAKAIEDMVVMLRRDVSLTDYALAKQSMGRVTAAGRRLARDAKLLACYRDGLPVKFHKSFRNRNVPKRSP